jgi:hypothetical protein
METTTIEIKKSQARALDSVANGSYKDKLQVLIDCYNEQGQSLDEATVRSIAQEEINDMVAYKALE